VQDLASGGVDVSDGATQPDRTNAASGGQGRVQPAVIVVPCGSLEQLDAEALAVPSGSRRLIHQNSGKSQ
jgi:hypothetical protein